MPATTKQTRDDTRDPNNVLFPANAPPLRIAGTVFRGDHAHDGVVVGYAEDGRWFVEEGEVRVFSSPQELAAALWNNGDPGLFWVEVLFKMGWLAPNPDVIARAQREAFTKST